MASNSRTIETLLDQLQTMARTERSDDEAFVMSFRLPPDLALPGAEVLLLTRDIVDAMDGLVESLGLDLRFEHMDRTKDSLMEFIARAWADKETDQVRLFVTKHARPVLDLTCFIPIEYLTVESETSLVGTRLLPVTHPSIPTSNGRWFELKPPIGCVAAVPVRGTNLEKMAQRGRALLGHTLRVSRVALREHNAINDRQLRFRLGIAYAFSNQASGWRSRDDVAYDLTLAPSALAAIMDRPVWKMPAVPVNDVDKKADLALRWMERARFAGEPLIALLYLFFALEALLGDKSEGLKADAIAFRQLALSHIVSGGFRHPNDTWFLYDQVRSAAVHGSQTPVIDDETVCKLEWSVRDTLIQYLTLAEERGIRRRGDLIKAITSHPDIPNLADWIRKHAGSDWETYLQRVLPPSEQSDGS